MKSPPLIQRLIPILHEDASFLAVDKPAGVDVGGLPHETTAGLTELVAALHGRNETLHPGNRPSRFESGVLLFGKDSAAAVRIRTALKSFRLEREYVAVVNGRMKTPTMAVAADRGLSGEKVQKGRRGGGRAGVVMGTLIRCETTAPTTHALRTQLRSVGLRLVGDRLHDRSTRPAAHEDTCLHLAR